MITKLNALKAINSRLKNVRERKKFYFDNNEKFIVYHLMNIEETLEYLLEYVNDSTEKGEYEVEDRIAFIKNRVEFFKNKIARISDLMEEIEDVETDITNPDGQSPGQFGLVVKDLEAANTALYNASLKLEKEIEYYRVSL